MTVGMQLGGQIRGHREALGLSQDDLARRIFVSRQTVSNWETGRTYPDVQNLLLLGNLFDITLDELVKGDVETMDKEIKRNGHRIIAWSVAGVVLLVVGTGCLVASVALDVMAKQDTMLWTSVSGLVCFVSAAVFVWVYKLQKDIDVLTYKELRAYLSGGEVDRSARKGQPWSWKKLAVIGAACLVGGILAGLGLSMLMH